ncbi:hypothetical protein GQ44DRAFT_599473, partial [Phaeosphaeriaceae sp. PMI808]
NTYFLQLPYRFVIPLLILSSTLHWLVSQSIFIVDITFYDIPESIDIFSSNGHNWETCRFSPIAAISAVSLAFFMFTMMLGLGFVPHKKGMPLAGSCSLAISAACHLDQKVDPDGAIAAVKKLQWGVVGTNGDGVGHCSFSTEEVESP